MAAESQRQSNGAGEATQVHVARRLECLPWPSGAWPRYSQEAAAAAAAAGKNPWLPTLLSSRLSVFLDPRREEERRRKTRVDESRRESLMWLHGHPS